jgi:hypothetical protein
LLKQRGLMKVGKNVKSATGINLMILPAPWCPVHSELY